MSTADSTERNKAVIEALVEAINEQDWDRLEEVVAPNFVRHSSAATPPGLRSRSELKRFLIKEFETFPDARETIEDVIAEGDKVAVRHRFRGTQTGVMGPYPASGRVMVADYIAIYRLVNGVIIEAWVVWDNLAGLEQLGHLDTGSEADGTMTPSVGPDPSAPTNGGGSG